MKNSLLSSGLKLSIMTLLSRVLGLVREMTKASFLGTSRLADAFGVAFMIPNLLRRLFAENSISVAFIPTFKAYLEDKNIGKDELKDFLNATFTFISFITTVAVIVGILITPFIVPFFTDDTTAEMLREMTFLTRIMFPYLMVISVAAFFQGILNGVKIFTVSGFTPILFNICVIGATYLLTPFSDNPARAMSYGVTFGGILQACFQIPFVLKAGFTPRFTHLKKAFSNPGTKRVIALVAPTIVGMALYQLNDVVSTILAGRSGEGIVSSLQYSIRLQELILGIFVVTIGTVILPDLSSFAKNKLWGEFNTILVQSTHIIALVTIPITFFALLFGENIIKLVYQSNNFTDESVRLTLHAFIFHIAGLYFIGLNRIIAPAFYAQQNTKLPTLAGIIGFCSNIVFALILAPSMQGGGLALALSAASFINTVMLCVFMQKNKNIHVAQFLKSNMLYAVKLTIFSVIAIAPLYIFKDALFSPFSGMHRFLAQGIPLLISVLIFSLIGVGLLIASKDTLVFMALKKLKR